MDSSLLFLSCKRGDLTTVKHLVEQRETDTNIRDKWDSTPLYYACLCGHIEVVQYLLENGARCEAHTFDGERCLYGALNIEIRNLLRNFKVMVSTCTDLYVGFLKRILETHELADIKFIVQGTEIYAHRCIICARSNYFNEMFHKKWLNRSEICISNFRVRPTAFKAILQYVYTGEMEILIDQVEDCLLLAKQCQLTALIDSINDAVKKSYTFACTKPGTNVTTLLIESNYKNNLINLDFGVLIDQAIPIIFRQWINGSELPFLPNPDHVGFEDMCFIVEDHNFLCHQVFVVGRSDYFKAMLRNHFLETEMANEKKELVSIKLHDIPANIFIHILYYIYQDETQLTEDAAFDVLCAADLCLLPGLKKRCADFLVERIQVNNCIQLFKISVLFQLAKLENQTVEFMAHHIFELVEMTEFEELVQEEVRKVKNREEVDSMPLIDDIRFHITSNVQTISEINEANDQLVIIDALLEKLGLDG